MLGRASSFAEHRWALPGWAALPSVVSTLSLLIAVVGMYWDIALHIDDGRDPGRSPFGALPDPRRAVRGFAAGFLAVVLASSGR